MQVTDTIRYLYPDYKPDTVYVSKGDTIEWINEDNSAMHAVTSSDDLGETFNSGLMATGDKFRLNTGNFDTGTHEYMCILHPWMKSTLIVEESN